MTIQEFSDQFDILYSSNTDGNDTIDEYQKSVYLTKAQYQIMREYYEFPSGPTETSGFDGSAKRQIDFSALMRTKSVTPSVVAKTSSPYPTLNLYKATLSASVDTKDPYDNQIMFAIQEMVTVTPVTPSNSNAKLLQVVPIKHSELMRVLAKPFGQPLKRQAWRIFTVTERDKALTAVNIDSEVTGTTGESDIFYQDMYLIVHHNETIDNYTITYIKRPQPILLLDLSDSDLSIEGQKTVHGCELDPTIHTEVLERAVTLAKAALAGTTSTLANRQQRQESKNQ